MEEEIVEIKEIIEEINYSFSTNEYRKKLIRKISVILFSALLIFVSRLFDRYAAFDIIMSSLIFRIFIYVISALAIGLIVYLKLSKNTIDSESTNKIHKRLLNGFDLLSIIPLFMAVISISNAFFFSPATVIGQSMEPSFYEGEDILMWHLTDDYSRFDVIVLETDNSDYYLKRIIGLPGDNVIIDHNVITINGETIEQKFLENEYGSIDVYTYCDSSLQEVCEFNVPANYYFVLGDNREHSLDSRSNELGYVSEERIYGTVTFKFNNIFKDIFN